MKNGCIVMCAKKAWDAIAMATLAEAASQQNDHVLFVVDSVDCRAANIINDRWAKSVERVQVRPAEHVPEDLIPKAVIVSTPKGAGQDLVKQFATLCPAYLLVEQPGLWCWQDWSEIKTLYKALVMDEATAELWKRNGVPAIATGLPTWDKIPRLGGVERRNVTLVCGPKDHPSEFVNMIRHKLAAMKARRFVVYANLHPGASEADTKIYWEQISDLITFRFGKGTRNPNLQPEKVMMSSRYAIMAAASTMWQTASLLGCHPLLAGEGYFGEELRDLAGVGVNEYTPVTDGYASLVSRNTDLTEITNSPMFLQAPEEMPSKAILRLLQKSG